VTKWFGSTRSGEESNVSIGDRVEDASSCLAQMDALPLARALISTLLNELVDGTDLYLKLDAAFQNLVRILKSRQEFG